MIEVIAINYAVLMGFNTLLWLLSLRLKDASIVDLWWGLGFVVVAWTTRAQLGAPSAESIVLPIAATLWGVRLSVYLSARNIGHGEDKRYQDMRARRPEKFWWWSYFWVFLFQGTLCVVFSLPLQLGQIAPRASGLSIVEVIGLAIFAAGFIFESVADYQLAHFKRDPANKGKVMDAGLWRYTRHPNYFGETVLWWGLGLASLAAPEAAWGLIGPALLTFFLLRVSGVSLLEETIVVRRPAYADYIRRTNTFIPGPPKA